MRQELLDYLGRITPEEQAILDSGGQYPSGIVHLPAGIRGGQPEAAGKGSADRDPPPHPLRPFPPAPAQLRGNGVSMRRECLPRHRPRRAAGVHHIKGRGSAVPQPERIPREHLSRGISPKR